MTLRDHAARVAAGHPVTGLDYLLVAAAAWPRVAVCLVAAVLAALAILATRTPTYEAARVWRVSPPELGEGLAMAVDWQALEPRTPVQVQRRGPYVRAVALHPNAEALADDLAALSAWLEGEVVAGRAVLDQQRRAVEADWQARQERRATRLWARAEALRIRATAAAARQHAEAVRRDRATQVRAELDYRAAVAKADRAHAAAEATYRQAVAAHEAALARRPTSAMVTAWRAEIARIERDLPAMPVGSAGYWTARALTLHQRIEAAAEPAPPAPTPPAPPEAVAPPALPEAATLAAADPPLTDDPALDDPLPAAVGPAPPEAVVVTDRPPAPLQGKPWTWPLVTAAVSGAGMGLGWAYIEVWWHAAWLRRAAGAPAIVAADEATAVQRWS